MRFPREEQEETVLIEDAQVIRLCLRLGEATGPAASFDALMGPAGQGIPDPEVLLTGDWTSVRTVVDVGGGTGSLLAEILRARPDLRGILVDFPSTVARSSQIFQAAGVADRV